MKKLKILHYIPGFNTGGIESVFLNWFRNLDKEILEFELLVRNYDPNSPMLREYLDLGGKLHSLDTPSLNLKTMLSFYCKVDRFFKDNIDYDFLHVHVADDPFLIDIAKKRGITKVGIHAHTTNYNESYKSKGLKSRIRSHNVKISNHYLAITQAASNWMFPDQENVHILHNGIEAKKYIYDKNVRKNYRNHLQLENKYVLMHVGRFSEVKNHVFMLDLFEKIKVATPNSLLLFVGDGPLYEKIQVETSSRNLQDSVIHLGARSDVPELLQAADVFLLPSKFEGLGLSAVEAQAAGLPTVVSDQVPAEVAITDLVTFLPLEAPLAVWKAAIEEMKTVERRNTYPEIVEAHYEIRKTIADLTEFYISTYEE